MPLPRPGQPWPPQELQPALDTMSEWHAWWAGDSEKLAAYYGGGPGIAGHPAQHSGGVLGKLARMWWGRPPAAGEPHAKLHVPLAGDICRTSANMLFGEPIVAKGADPATTASLGELLDQGSQSKLLEAAELQAALGGIYLRPVADPSIAERAWLDAVRPNAALPEWKWGRLSAVTFWRIVKRDDRWVWRHFERHEPGYIVHALYQGQDGDVGRPVPLTEVEATAGFAPLVSAEGAIVTGYPYLTASYVPNMRPSPDWIDDPLLAPFGRSDLDGAEPILDALDETYSSLMRDIRLAKGRIIVGDNMLEDAGPGRGARFDPDREAYSVLSGALPKDVPITVQQFDIRVEKLTSAAHELRNLALQHAGYALITLGEVEGGQAMTATEVTAKGQLSFVTQGRKRGYWTPVLELEALPALAVVDAIAHRRPMPNLSKPIGVEWPDSITEDLSSLAGTVEVLERAEAASTYVKVDILHKDWTEPEKLKEVARILEERASAAPPAPIVVDPDEAADLRNGPPDDEDVDEDPDEDEDPDDDEDDPDADP